MPEKRKKLGNHTEQTFDETIADVLGPDASDQWGAPGLWFHHRLEVKDRAEVLERVFLDSDPRWLSAFIVMLLLSGGIATLGLSSDSAATVIGSMVVAPLGGPIVALGGSIATVWPRQAAKMFLTIIAGSAAVVLVAYIMGIFLPNATPNAQILARTNPDLRDLGVALLAGAAGAYAQTRRSLASSLVGVAIAVALVPPLATIGLMLEEGRWALATGAFTLFAANFVGITLAVAATLLITRYAPLPKLRPASKGLAVGLGVTILAIAALTIPLGKTYLQVVDSSQTVTAVHQQVSDTIQASSAAAVVNKVTVDGNMVTIDLSDLNNVPSAAQFESDLKDEIGPNVTVELR